MPSVIRFRPRLKGSPYVGLALPFMRISVLDC